MPNLDRSFFSHLGHTGTELRVSVTRVLVIIPHRNSSHEIHSMRQQSRGKVTRKIAELSSSSVAPWVGKQSQTPGSSHAQKRAGSGRDGTRRERRSLIST